MRKPNNRKISVVSLVLITAAALGIFKGCAQRGSADQVTKEINPFIGSIKTTISTTGTVLPKNRLQVMPPVNGRIEEIMVREGQQVKLGQVLSSMSSTERAALLDAARAQGQESVAYWEEVYKPISLISPIDGEVIVATTQPGQTVTTGDAVVVLSDQLIVRAQVDETDIGNIQAGQGASISLDAYPDNRIPAKVEHIYYESETVNNVTIYKVDLIPDKIPPFFRSGMNATINFIVNDKENVLLLPAEAVTRDNNSAYVLVREKNKREPVKRVVELGVSDDKNVEILSGVTERDGVLLKASKYSLPTGNTGSNPFTPFGRGRKKTGR